MVSLCPFLILFLLPFGFGASSPYLYPSGCDAVENRPRVEAPGRGYGDPRQLADPGYDGGGHEDVDGAVAIGEVVGNQTTYDTYTVQEEEQIE